METQKPFGEASKTNAKPLSPGLQALKAHLKPMTEQQKQRVQNEAVRTRGRGWSRVNQRAAQFTADLSSMERDIVEPAGWADLSGAPTGT